MKKNNLKKKLNIYIKNKILNDFIQHKEFLKSIEDSEELFNLFIIKNELWVSIYFEKYFEKYLSRQKLQNFSPFILFPVKTNNYLKYKNEETNENYFLKLSSINIKTLLNKEFFYIQNKIEHSQIPEEEVLLILDKNRKIQYFFSNEDKKILIKELKKLKKLDVFNLFEIKKLKYFIEKKLENYLTNTNNFLFISNIDEDINMIDLKTTTIKKEFKETKPISFIIKEEKIYMNITED